MSLEPITSSLPPADAERAKRLAMAVQKLHALNADVSRLVDQIDRWNGRVSEAAPAGEPINEPVSLEHLDRDIAALTGMVRELESRLRGLEDMSLVAPRKPMHIRLAEAMVGREYYRPYWRKAAVPGATLVVPIGEDEATAATVRSVLAASGPAWEIIVVGPEPGPRLQLAIHGSAGRVRHERGNGALWECLDRGLAEAAKIGGGNIIGILHPGQRLEPTAAGAVTRFFRDHPRAMVAYFERVVRRGAWRMPMPRGRRMDVYALLAEPGTNDWGHGGVFFRRAALGMVGGYKPAMRSAAEWHLYLRLTRMFGMRRAPGQVLSIDADEAGRERCGEYLEFEQARQEFLGNFGALGRVRCRVIHIAHSIEHAIEPVEPALPLPPAAAGEQCDTIGELPDCPLTGEKADRLLFTATGDIGEPFYVYDCRGIAAMIRPAHCLLVTYESPAPPPRDAAPPEQLAAADESLRALLLSRVPPEDPTIRALIPFDSPAGDWLARQTQWKLARLTAGMPLADAALVLPEAERFDVIWAGSDIRQSADPAGILRSLRSVLAPSAIVAIAGPNFDSRSRRQLGPNWPGWNIPRHPLILGRRGVKELARLSDLHVLKWQDLGETWLVLLQSE